MLKFFMFSIFFRSNKKIFFEKKIRKIIKSKISDFSKFSKFSTFFSEHLNFRTFSGGKNFEIFFRKNFDDFWYPSEDFESI